MLKENDFAKYKDKYYGVFSRLPPLARSPLIFFSYYYFSSSFLVVHDPQKERERERVGAYARVSLRSCYVTNNTLPSRSNKLVSVIK